MSGWKTMIYQEDEILAFRKCIIQAPAGYGKTHLIARIIQKTTKRNLVLTHTHAGVASIKEKLKAMEVDEGKYHIETIMGYAQKYVLSFKSKNETSQYNIAETDKYYGYIITSSRELFKLQPIKEIISNNYGMLFVDEYQDCTMNQDELISALINILPTYVFGDYMQAIFGFRGMSVDMNKDEFINKFERKIIKLNTPWRWINSNNAQLGEALSDIRGLLEKGTAIDVKKYKSIKYYRVDDSNHIQKALADKIWEFIGRGELLIIHSDSTNKHKRIKIIQQFCGQLKLIEAIDDKDFYEYAKKIDDKQISSKDLIYDISKYLFKKGIIDKWIKRGSLINKRSEREKETNAELRRLYSENASIDRYVFILKALEAINRLPGIICYREELYKSIINALKSAIEESSTVYTAMVEKRNKIRRIGRNIKGCWIGTTLLVKGLEFENVVVLDADKFKDSKNLYVALTRATKELIIVSSSNILTVGNDI